MLLALCVPPLTAQAIFYNNTETIEVGDGEPPEPPGWVGGVNTNTPGSGSSGNSGGGSGATPPLQTSTTTPNANTSTSQSTGNSSSPGSGSGANSANEETVWSALLTGGALFGSFGEGGVLGSDIDFEGGYVRIVASRVRDIFRENSTFSEFLTFWKRGSGASARERGLIAVSTAVRDSNFEEATFTATRVDITYRSRGYLLGFIPWSFPVRVSIIPAASSLDERVTVKFPWYRWFLRTFFSRQRLAEELDEALQTAYKNADPNDDLATVTFEAATEYLRQKVGTISDTILRGN